MVEQYSHKNEPGSIAPGNTYPIVNLPGGAIFLLDPNNGWTITGEPPKITVQPSINVHRGWHGYITDGVISDDVSGKVF